MAGTAVRAHMSWLVILAEMRVWTLQVRYAEAGGGLPEEAHGLRARSYPGGGRWAPLPASSPSTKSCAACAEALPPHTVRSACSPLGSSGVVNLASVMQESLLRGPGTGVPPGVHSTQNSLGAVRRRRCLIWR